MLTVRVVTTDLEEKMDLLVDAVSDISEPLRAFGAYLRKRTRKRFQDEGPGWPALADSTQQKLEHTRTARITAAGKVRKSSELALRRKIRRESAKGKIGLGALRELEDVLRGRKSDPLAKAFESQLSGTALESFNAGQNRTLSRLREDLARHAGKSAEKRRAGARQSQRHKLLGKLASSIRASVRGNLLVVESIVDWAGVHNVGGSAGHGSSIPKREFLTLESEDVDVLRTLLEARMVKALE